MGEPLDGDKLANQHFEPDFNAGRDKQERKSTLNFDFDGQAVVLFEGEHSLLGRTRVDADHYARLIHLLNQSSKEISEAISAELRKRLKSVGSDVSVDIEFTNGSLIFDGLISITDFLDRLDGTVGGIKLIIDAAKFAINKVIRTEIENTVPATVKRITTNVSERRIKEKDPINAITRAQWWCAGAVTDILRQCPEDKAKYQTIGTAVFTTGLLAAISGSYALSTMLGDETHAVVLAIVIGLIWGCIIFNLDRSVVSSMRKGQNQNATWVRRVLSETRMALPRIILAVILGLVICKPLELRFFKNQISNKVESERTERADLFAETLRNGKYSAELQATKQELLNAEEEVKRARVEVEKYTKIFNDEMDANGGTGRYGYGPVATKKEADKLKAVAQLARAESLLQQTREKSRVPTSLVEQRIANERDQYAASIKNDFSRQLEALWQLTSESRGLWWANIGIIILLIMIELFPILVKLFSPAGPYDARLDQRERVAKEKARLGKESEVACATLKAESAIAEAKYQSDVHKEELRLRRVAANNVAGYRYERLAASERAFLNALFKAVDEARTQVVKDDLTDWRLDSNNGNVQPFDDLLRQEFKNKGINLTA